MFKRLALTRHVAAAPYKWLNDSGSFQEAIFQTPKGQKYYVEFANTGGAWTFIFANNTSGKFETDQTNTGEAATVMVTVLAILKEFLARQQPRSLLFTAKSTEASRVKLYDSFVQRLQKMYPGTHVQRTPSASDVGYFVTFTW